MNTLQVFNYNDHDIRTVQIDNLPWWVAKDVCDILEIDSSQTRRLDEDEKGLCLIQTLGGYQEMQVINEPGLYSLILGSRKSEAKVFKRWITHEVIPSIRKHGLYARDELLDNPDLLIDIVSKLKMERDKRLLAESEVKQKTEVIEYKNEVIEGLVDKVDVYTKRTVLNRVVKHGGANFQHRYRELYRVFREMNGIDLKARCEGYNRSQLLKKSHLSVIKYAEKFGYLDNLYKAAVRLYETDVNEILESVRRMN